VRGAAEVAEQLGVSEVPTVNSGISAMFRPRRILVVGASDDRSRAGGRVLDSVRKWKFDGEIVCVGHGGRGDGGENRNEDWHASIEDACERRGRVDLAVVAVGTSHVMRALDELSAADVQAAVVFASGGGGDRLAGLAREIGELAAGCRMRVLGPNTGGVILPHASLPASIMRNLAREAQFRGRGLAIVSNSGGLANELLWEYLRRGGEVGAWVGVGAEADIRAGEVMTEMASLSEVDSVVTILESVLHPKEYLDGARALALAGKPVFAFRCARLRQTAPSAALHSGTARVPGATWSTTASWCGVTEFGSLDELTRFLCTVGTSADLRKARGTTDRAAARIGLVTVSGGGAVTAVDRCAEVGVQLVREVGPKIEALLRAHELHPALPADVGAGTFGTPEAFGDFCATILRADEVDAVWVQASTALYPKADVVRVFNRIAPVADAVQKLTIISGLLPSAANDQGLSSEYAKATDSLESAIGIFATRDRVRANEWKAGRHGGDTGESGGDAGRPFTGEGSLAEVLELAREKGYQVPDSVFCTSSPVKSGERRGDATRARVRALFPVVVKANSMRHKSAVGWVIRNVCSEGGLAYALGALAARGSDEVIVQRAVPDGPELLIGCFVDDDAGPVVVCGAGGSRTDESGNREIMRLPVGTAAVAAAVELVTERDPALAISAEQRAAVVRLVGKLIQDFTARGDGVRGIELNPVILSDGHLWVVDIRTV
jgi:acyl-CoA synthetase (NDP forming)